MSYEQRKIKRRKREKRYRRLILIIGIILLIILVSSLINKRIKTITASEEVFLKEEELQGVVIKDETVFKVNDNKIDIDDNEGKIIPVGTKISTSSYLKDLDLLNKDLEKINSVISSIEENEEKDYYENNQKDLTNDYENEVSKLQEIIYLEDYSSIKNLKKDIISINKDLKETTYNSEFLGENIDSLKDKRDKLGKEINKKDSFDHSPVSGIVSYDIDGYENEFRAKSFEGYTFNKLKIPNEEINKSGQTKKKSDVNGFKVIDNLEWYLALKVDDRKDLKEYKIGEELFINYPLEDGHIELNGDIVSINNSSNKAVIVLKFNKYLHDFYNSRFPKVKLIEEKVEGFKIPNKVIINNKGKKGVFIKDFSGIVKFKPIKIISVVDDYTYIYKGDDGIINLDDGKEISTISIFDEILVKPYKYKEGQILE